MKQRDIAVGRTYAVKVSDRIVPVRVTSETTRVVGYGLTRAYRPAWHGTNLVTNREVRIYSAQRFRYEVVQGSAGKWTRKGKEVGQ